MYNRRAGEVELGMEAPVRLPRGDIAIGSLKLDGRAEEAKRFLGRK